MNIDTFRFYRDRFRRFVRRVMSHGQKDSSGTLNIEQNLKGRFCLNPFVQMDFYEDGKVHSCCSSWLPTSLGNLRKTSIMDLWNSPNSQMIRESILDGSFRYCNHKVCPMIQEGTLPTVEEARKDIVLKEIIDEKKIKLDTPPQFLNLCNDLSCNLYCPSCRVRKTINTEGWEYELAQSLQDRITEELFIIPSDRPFTINITGSGDPFASPAFREFLFNLNGEDFPNMKIHLQTNGVLLTPKNWKKMEKIHDRIATALISFDAGTEEIYNITRRGGNWQWLQENTRRLGELRTNGELKFLRLDYVVQQANYREMPQFIEIAKSLNADRVFFSMVLDWGTWSISDYEKQWIWKQDHPEFDDFISVLENPIFDDPMVNLGNLTEYRQMAKQRLQKAG